MSLRSSGLRATCSRRTKRKAYLGGQRESGGSLKNPRDKVTFPRLNLLLDVVANRTRRNLRLERDAPIRPLTATPLAFWAVGSAITRRCVSDGRLNQQQ